MSNLIILAANLANNLHSEQQRKYTGRPYVEHPARVAGRIARHTRATEEMVCAAWLHDVLEDCKITEIELLSYSVENVWQQAIKLVGELTNPSKKHPELYREARKEMDRKHMAAASPEAKMLKLVDRCDNLLEMNLAPPDFIRLYLKESRLLFDALKGTDEQLETEFIEALNKLETSLNS